MKQGEKRPFAKHSAKEPVTFGPVRPVTPGAQPAQPMGQADRRQRRSHIGAMRAVKAVHAADRTVIQRTADALTRLAASPWFLNVHIAWFLFWIVVNSGLTPIRPFDPFPFGLLTMVVSLEAIFLAIFVLMAQSRDATIAELREELMLQVNLRMEAEVTKTLQLVAGLYTRLGQKVGEDAELQEMLQPLDSEEIERELMAQIRAAVHNQQAMKKSLEY